MWNDKTFNVNTGATSTAGLEVFPDKAIIQVTGGSHKLDVREITVPTQKK